MIYKTMIADYDNLKVPQATIIQRELRTQLEIKKWTGKLKTIAGADVSLNMFGKTIYAGIIVLSYPDLQPVAHSLVKAEVRFPYVPGYLSFREIPALYKAWEQLPVKPDMLVVDGHGIAHPRRMGIAAHFGTVTSQPTIGCAKKILFGKFKEPAGRKNSFRSIYDKQEVIGYAIRSKSNVNPVFISPGNLVDLSDSIEIMKKCFGNYRIPEPTRLAHELVNKFRTGQLEEGYMEL
jgi:deoxyribonuclease V